MNLSGQHLLELINDLLDISKIEAGQMTLNPDLHNASALVDEILKKFVNRAQASGVQLQDEVEDFLFSVDAKRFRQILFNLVGNALKFTHDGVVQVRGRRNEGEAEFEVCDTGIGIPLNELPYIFEPFRQVDGSSTRQAGGTGLGLAITRRLVELHGGTIKAESQPGQGTVFRFTIRL